MSRLLLHGIGFHHGGLPQEIRRTMEECIASGAINILICTNTLAEGVNLPIRTLVVHTFRRFDEATETTVFIERRSIKNIIGRVGRAGKETRGRIVFANEGDHSTVIEVLREVGLEPAVGRLYRLIERIEQHFRQHRIALTNDVLEKQHPWFLALIDNIDHAIIDLVPDAASSEQMAKSIDELLDRTLAKHQSQTDAFKKTLYDVFKLRGTSLQTSIPKESWVVLKKSGATPRFWNSVQKSKLLEKPLWNSLADANDPKWREEIVGPMLSMTRDENSLPAAFLFKVVSGWIAGKTYVEIASDCQCEVGEVLTAMCDEIGFRLQDGVAKLTQLALAQHGEEGLSETRKDGF